MRRAIDLLGSNFKQGVRVIGSPKAGCRHCGAVVRAVSEDGNVIVYRPAAECCYSALADQIERCRENIREVRARLAERELEHRRMEEELDVTDSKARLESLRRRIKKAETNMPRLREQAVAEITDLTNEIKRLRTLQARLNHNLGL